MELFITKLFDHPAVYVSTVIAYAGSICLHEYSHAYVAHRLGDNTAKDGGFMSVNPLKVMGLMSIVALLVFGISWGAVPVQRDDPSRLRRAAISLSGPLCNLGLLAIFSVLLKICCVAMPGAFMGNFAYYVRLFLIMALFANAVLFLFNILPIPPLDGWATIEPFLPNFLVPNATSKKALFQAFIYLMCFTSASGLFDKLVENFTDKFLPRQIATNNVVAEGEQLLEAEDFVGAYNKFMEAASQGNSEGKLNLAVCLVEGIGCEPNEERAFELFSEKDVCGYPMAKFYLGTMRMQGLGCQTDYDAAYRMLSQDDVQQTGPVAKVMLGNLLAEGFGTPQDLQKAYELFSEEEVLNASSLARFYVGCFLMEGTVCPRDEKRGFNLLNDTDVMQYPLAKFLVGMCYYAGTGTTQDFKAAAKYLKEAADEGEENAVQFLGYENGMMPDYGVPLEDALRNLWEQSK